MSYIALTVINRVTRNRRADRNHSRNIGKAVIADPEECEIVASKVVLALAIELVLLSMLQAFKPFPKANPPAIHALVSGLLCRPSGRDVGIAIVAGELHEADETRLRNISRNYVD